MSIPALNSFLETIIEEKIDPLRCRVIAHPDAGQDAHERFLPDVFIRPFSARPYPLPTQLQSHDAIGLVCRYEAAVINQGDKFTATTLITAANVAAILQGTTLVPTEKERSYIAKVDNPAGGAGVDWLALNEYDYNAKEWRPKLIHDAPVLLPILEPRFGGVSVQGVDFGGAIKFGPNRTRLAPVVHFTVAIQVTFNDLPLVVDPEVDPYLPGQFDGIFIESPNKSIEEFQLWPPM